MTLRSFVRSVVREGLRSARALGRAGRDRAIDWAVARASRAQDPDASRRNEDFLRRFEELAAVGGWELDTRTGALVWTDSVYRIFELPIGSPPSFERALEFFPLEARPPLERALERAMRDGTPYELELPFITASGKRIWTRSIGRPHREGDAIVRLTGAFVDITAEREAKTRLALQASAMAASSAGIAIVDARAPDLPLIYVNDAFVRMTGFGSDEVLGRNCRFLQRGDREQDAVRTLRVALEQGRAAEVLLRNYRKDGALFWNELSISPVRDADGSVTHFIGVSQDVTSRIESEHALRESEERFRRAADGAPALIRLVDARGESVWFNRRWLEIFGSSLEHACERGWLVMLPSDEAERCGAEVVRAFDARRPVELEYRVRCADGSDVFVAETAVPRFHADGTFDGFVGYGWDITSRKRAQDAVRKQERLAAVIARAQSHFIVDADATLAFERLLHDLLPLVDSDVAAVGELVVLDTDELALDAHGEPKTVWHVAHSVDPAVAPPFQPLQRAMSLASLFRRTASDPGCDAMPATLVMPLEIRGAVVGALGFARRGRPYDESMLAFLAPMRASLARLVEAVRSERRRRRAEAALRASERRLQGVLDSMFAYIGLFTPGGTVLDANRAALDLLGLAREDAIGRRVLDVSAKLLPIAEVHGAIVRAAAGEAFREELRLADGRVLDATFGPLCDDRGFVVQVVGSAVDVTERHRAETAARQLATRMRAVVEHMNDGLVTIDEAGRVVSYNVAAERIFGRPESDVVGRSVELLVPEALRDTYRASLTGGRENGAEVFALTREVQGLCADGRAVPLELSVSSFVIDGHRYYTGIVRDISEMKRAQRALEASEGRLRRAQAYANIGTWDWNIATGDLYWSERIGPLFGYEGTVETSYANFIAAVHPDDRAQVQQAVADCIEQGIPYEAEHRIVRPDGGIRYVLERGDVVRDEDGTALHMLGLVQDITWRKAAEAQLVAAKEEAEKANRAKSEFLSSMSHELRTPLNAILGFAQLLETDPTLSVEQGESVTEILEGGRHLLDLIDDVLDLAKVESGRLEVNVESVACAAVVAEAMRLVEPSARRHGVSLAWDRETAFFVQADRVRLRQILVNLLSNAVKYNRPGGSVRLDFVPYGDDRVRIRVEDTGYGIPRERADELFQPFSRLGAESGRVEGTGIGLVISRRLAALLGGSLGFESEPDRGSVFWIELARARGETPRADADSREREAARANGGHAATVLLVEDNPVNLRLMGGCLSRRPHVRLLATDRPDKGLALAACERPDLILLDINLPDMDGYALLARLRSNPALAAVPIVAITANAMPHDVARGLGSGFAEYVTKPIDVARFLAMVDRLLDPSRVPDPS